MANPYPSPVVGRGPFVMNTQAETNKRSKTINLDAWVDRLFNHGAVALIGFLIDWLPQSSG
jgi:hypothetical protein